MPRHSESERRKSIGLFDNKQKQNAQQLQKLLMDYEKSKKPERITIAEIKQQNQQLQGRATEIKQSQGRLRKPKGNDNWKSAFILLLLTAGQVSIAYADKLDADLPPKNRYLPDNEEKDMPPPSYTKQDKTEQPAKIYGSADYVAQDLIESFQSPKIDPRPEPIRQIALNPEDPELQYHKNFIVKTFRHNYPSEEKPQSVRFRKIIGAGKPSLEKDYSKLSIDKLVKNFDQFFKEKFSDRALLIHPNELMSGSNGLIQDLAHHGLIIISETEVQGTLILRNLKNELKKIISEGGRDLVAETLKHVGRIVFYNIRGINDPTRGTAHYDASSNSISFKFDSKVKNYTIQSFAANIKHEFTHYLQFASGLKPKEEILEQCYSNIEFLKNLAIKFLSEPLTIEEDKILRDVSQNFETKYQYIDHNQEKDLKIGETTRKMKLLSNQAIVLQVTRIGESLVEYEAVGVAHHDKPKLLDTAEKKMITMLFSIAGHIDNPLELIAKMGPDIKGLEQEAYLHNMFPQKFFQRLCTEDFKTGEKHPEFLEKGGLSPLSSDEMRKVSIGSPTTSEEQAGKMQAPLGAVIPSIKKSFFIENPESKKLKQDRENEIS